MIVSQKWFRKVWSDQKQQQNISKYNSSDSRNKWWIIFNSAYDENTDKKYVNIGKMKTRWRKVENDMGYVRYSQYASSVLSHSTQPNINNNIIK